MKSIGPNRRFGMLMLFTLLLAVGSIGCSDTGGDAYALEAAWGAFACDEGSTGVQVCFGETVGDVSEDSCCREDTDCESNRCCTGPEQCSFDEPENRYTCRKPR